MPTAQLCLLLGKTKENESVMGECGTIIDKLDSADTWLVRALIGSWLILQVGSSVCFMLYNFSTLSSFSTI
ncbi:hypothetical protein PSHT_15697 [Puccinia striiformis]|nr:hypothetical protein PSHT_15697 [Puccinia striiformis]